VPHIASTRSVRTVPSWALGPCGRPTRPGACRPCSRVRRRTRRLEVRTPSGATRIVDPKPYEPAEQDILIELLDQQPLRPELRCTYNAVDSFKP
jgi:hypothetical protein